MTAATTAHISKLANVVIPVADVDRAIDWALVHSAWRSVPTSPSAASTAGSEVAPAGADNGDRDRPSGAGWGRRAAGRPASACRPTISMPFMLSSKAAGVDVDAEVEPHGRPCAADVLAARP